jgi:hypothetical protein
MDNSIKCNPKFPKLVLCIFQNRWSICSLKQKKDVIRRTIYSKSEFLTT